MNDDILSLMDKKIEQAERYREISNKMIYEDIDGVNEMLDRRQELITQIDGISAEIKAYVNSQSVEKRDVLNNMLSFREVGELSGELLELQDKLMRYKEVKKQINEADRKICKHIKEMQNELAAEMVRSNRSKQVIDYFKTTSIDVDGGSKFNMSN